MLNFLKQKNTENKYITIQNKSLLSPINHPLEGFMNEFRLYDRFLTVLAKHLPNDKKVIDIGANIGDTLFGMIDNCSSKFYCIEPSEYFFSFLEKNVLNLSKENRNRIILLKEMIGTGSFKGVLQQYHEGSAKLKLDQINDNKYISLDNLAISDVILIKVDTDGFDFDVIESAKQICKESKPILFWENEISEDFQLNGFEQMYYNLSELGYDTLFIFDNFGNLIFENSNFETLKQLNTYIYSMKKYDCTRTIFYTDVLAVSDKHKGLVTNAIEDYKRSCILK
jgi:FkbM family methyltransferase